MRKRELKNISINFRTTKYYAGLLHELAEMTERSQANVLEIAIRGMYKREVRKREQKEVL